MNYVEDEEIVTSFDADGEPEGLGEFASMYIGELYNDNVNVDEDSIQVAGYQDGRVSVELELVYDASYNSEDEELPGSIEVSGSSEEELVEEGKPVEEFVEAVKEAV
jgi:hypothetical protein